MLGDNDIIFRTDWLHAHNPEVDWSLPQVAFTRCSLSCTLSKKPLVITSKKAQTCATMINTIHPDPEEWDTTEDTFTTEAIENFIYVHSFVKQDAIHIQAKTTTSTEIAACMVPKPSMEHIPTQFQKYTKVFSEEASQ